MCLTALPCPAECIPPKKFKEYQISAAQHIQDVLPVGQASKPQTDSAISCPATFGQTKVFA
jgi:hypothetical protein